MIDDKTPLERAVLIHVLERAPVKKTASSWTFTFDPGRGHRVAAAQVDVEDETMYLVFTHASQSERVFLTLTDADPGEIAEILAQIEAFRVNGEPLGDGETLKLEGQPYMAKHGRVAAMLMRPSVIPPLAAFGEHVDLAGKHISFSLVVFLDEREYEVKKQKGLDAVLDRFEAEDRDLIRFQA